MEIKEIENYIKSAAEFEDEKIKFREKQNKIYDFIFEIVQLFNYFEKNKQSLKLSKNSTYKISNEYIIIDEIYKIPFDFYHNMGKYSQIKLLYNSIKKNETTILKNDESLKTLKKDIENKYKTNNKKID
jgi:hypothetical protein